MNRTVNVKRLVLLGIISVMGTLGSLLVSIVADVSDMLHHYEPHLAVLFFDVVIAFLICSPSIIFSVYLIFFARKKLSHPLLYASCIFFALRSLWQLVVVASVTLVNGFDENTLNLLLPLRTIKDLITTGNIFGFTMEIGLTFYFYGPLLSVVFCILAIVTARKGFKKMTGLKVLATVIMVLNLLFTVINVPFGIEEFWHGFQDYLPRIISESMMIVSFCLFWIICIKKGEEGKGQTDIKTELAKANYLLEIGMITQEEFEKKKSEITELSTNENSSQT